MNRQKPPTGVILFFANIGSGKTTLLTKYAQNELKRIQKGKSKYKYVVSNAQISGVTFVEDIRGMIKKGALKDTLILIEEASIIYNNRKMNMTEQEIQYFKLIRHYNSCCVAVSQAYNDIDVTLRRLYTRIYLLNYLPIFTLIRPIKKTVGIDDITHDICDMYQFKNIFTWRLLARPVYFKFFNSWWIPKNVPIHSYEEYEIIPYPEQKKRITFIKGKVKEVEKILDIPLPPSTITMDFLTSGEQDSGER